MTAPLASRDCIPCRGGVPPLEGEDLASFYKALGNDWALVEDHHLEKAYVFPNFQTALDFTNRVGAIAEEQDHHPDILLAWGEVVVTIWTHKIDGLTESDFIFAAKCDLAHAV